MFPIVPTKDRKYTPSKGNNIIQRYRTMVARKSGSTNIYKIVSTVVFDIVYCQGIYLYVGINNSVEVAMQLDDVVS